MDEQARKTPRYWLLTRIDGADGRDRLLLAQKSPAGRHLKVSKASFGDLFGSYSGRTYGSLPVNLLLKNLFENKSR
jgi:hypothetical protein